MAEENILTDLENLAIEDDDFSAQKLYNQSRVDLRYLANDDTFATTEFATVQCDFDRSKESKQIMNLEAEAYDSIVGIGYNGPLVDKNEFKKALQQAPKNLEFTNLITFLTNQLHTICNLDENVSEVTSLDEVNSFIMELSSFLNELGCPHKSLMQGQVSQRLTTLRDKALLVNYLTTELMAAKIVNVKHPYVPMEIEVRESPYAADLCAIMKTLALSQPPSNIPIKALLGKLQHNINSSIQKAPELIGKPIFKENLSDAQWEALSKLQEEIHQEYTMRRQMILTRVDCTIQSFQWSERSKNKEELFDQVYYNERKLIKAEPDVDLSDFLIARTDLAVFEKTSSTSVRKNTKSAINNVLIGQVPDRGGRTSEQAPPPPEMPPWQKRTDGPSGGRGGGRGRGGSANISQRGVNSNFSQRGGNSNFSQRDDNFSQRGNGSSNYSQRGNESSNYSQRGNESSNYSQRGNESSNYSQKGNESSSYSQRADSALNYSQRSDVSSNYSQRSDRGSNYSQRSDRGSGYSHRGGSNRGGFDSAGSYGGRSDNYYDGKQGGSHGNGSGNYSRGSFDSAGSYGGYQEPKRIKTFDDFQQTRSTYADQYVQDNQNNQQYVSRSGGYQGRGGGHGGRSNYNRNNY